MTEIELETYLGKKIRVTHICGKQVEGMCEIFTPALDNEPEVAEIALKPEHYKRGFPNRRYKGMRGIMQQYIFYYDLHAKDRIGQAPN